MVRTLLRVLVTLPISTHVPPSRFARDGHDSAHDLIDDLGFRV